MSEIKAGSKFDPNTFHGERQEGPDLSYIQRGHVARYDFARTMVKGRVLDAACGCGYGSWMMNETGCRVVGVDIDNGAIQYAREHYKGPGYIIGDIYDSPWVGKFDWVVSFETIEHLTDPQKVLRLFREYGVRLICSTPNQLRYPFDPDKFKGDKYPHQRHYSPMEFTELLKSCGWKVFSQHCQETKSSLVSPGYDGMFLIFVCE